MKKVLFIMFGILGFPLFVSAAGLIQEDRLLIEEKLTVLEKGFHKADWRAMYNIMPPQLVKPSEEWIEMFVYGMELDSKRFTFQSVKFNLDKLQAEKSLTGRDYAFIPMVISWKNKRTEEIKQEHGYLFAFKENSKWYFLDWWDAESWGEYYKPTLKKAYPDLADVKPPQ